MTGRAVLILLGVAGLSPAQQPALSFEVASVKVSTLGGGVEGGCHGIDTVYKGSQREAPPPLGRCVITCARLSHLIGIAYGVTMQDLKTGPDWIQRGDLRFDVQAKAEDPTKTTEKQLLTMLQNLLVDRFQLKFHYENKDVPGSSLNVGKNAPKLQKSTSEEPSISFRGPTGEVYAKPAGGPAISLIARKCSVAQLASLLSLFGAAGPVQDKTGLTGEYDFSLSWDQENGPALSTAVRDQLGLVMKQEKVSTSTLVVDSAQKPAAN